MKATLLSKAGRPSLGQRFTSYDVFTSGGGPVSSKVEYILAAPEQTNPYYLLRNRSLLQMMTTRISNQATVAGYIPDGAAGPVEMIDTP